MRYSTGLVPVLAFTLLLTLTACSGGDRSESSGEAKEMEEGEAAVPAADQGSPEYIASIQEWREKRDARLRSKDGWLSVAGFFWLKEGDNTFGSAPGNDMVFPAGSYPENAGVLRMHASSGETTFEIVPAEGVKMTKVGEPFTGGEIVPGDPIGLGRLEFWVIERGGNYAVRLRDPESSLLTGFTGIENFPIQEAYRVTGKLVPYDPPKMIAVPNVLGYVDSSLAPGRFEFNLLGKDLSLVPIIDDPADTVLFFVFEDKTTGFETYGGGRFAYCDLQPDGTAVLDFNQAYNPPCALNEYTTCPLPPEGNKLPVPIRAGEKAYAGGH